MQSAPVRHLPTHRSYNSCNYQFSKILSMLEISVRKLCLALLTFTKSKSIGIPFHPFLGTNLVQLYINHFLHSLVDTELISHINYTMKQKAWGNNSCNNANQIQDLANNVVQRQLRMFCCRKHDRKNNKEQQSTGNKYVKVFSTWQCINCSSDDFLCVR